MLCRENSPPPVFLGIGGFLGQTGSPEVDSCQPASCGERPLPQQQPAATLLHQLHVGRCPARQSWQQEVLESVTSAGNWRRSRIGEILRSISKTARSGRTGSGTRLRQRPFQVPSKMDKGDACAADGMTAGNDKASAVKIVFHIKISLSVRKKRKSLAPIMHEYPSIRQERVER